ncbi:hypothetical protein HZ994_07815 [Akkermansiaceae bacterium]|nr:hypothetical protein HZ994_07815 [Akkermansiaceae bacterium]
MKTNNRTRTTSRAGMTLLELTVVILVLLSLISILFIGARAWKKGSDRAACILNIRNCQQALRGYANSYGITAGNNIPGGRTREDVIIGPGLFMDNPPVCPSGSSYTGLGVTTIPLHGELLMECGFIDGSLHIPENYGGW